jgi:hypothetical protein
MPIPDLDSWLKGFPYEKVVQRITELQEQDRRIQEELHNWEAARELYDRLRPPMPADSQSSSMPTDAGGGPVPVPGQTFPFWANGENTPTLRQAIITVLREGNRRDWETAAIRRNLVKRGWLKDTPQATNNLYAMLSHMTKQGQVKRPRMGHYRLAVSAPQVSP